MFRCSSTAMEEPRDKRQAPEQGKCGKLSFLLLLTIAFLVGDSKAFSSNNLLSVRASYQATISSTYHYNPRRHQRPSKQRRGALSYPIGTSDLDQNNSWAEIISPSPTHDNDHDNIAAADKIVLAGTIGFVGCSLLTLLKFSGPGSFRYFLAGGICAALSHTIPTPLDVVKVRNPLSSLPTTRQDFVSKNMFGFTIDSQAG
jgi:hypothetical protein